MYPRCKICGVHGALDGAHRVKIVSGYNVRDEHTIALGGWVTLVRPTASSLFAARHFSGNTSINVAMSICVSDLVKNMGAKTWGKVQGSDRTAGGEGCPQRNL